MRVPEKVPLRMTQNLEAALGLPGVEVCSLFFNQAYILVLLIYVFLFLEILLYTVMLYIVFAFVLGDIPFVM